MIFDNFVLGTGRIVDIKKWMKMTEFYNIWYRLRVFIYFFFYFLLLGDINLAPLCVDGDDFSGTSLVMVFEKVDTARLANLLLL